jgi:alginate O-acetyltransferase complex protein AlgJ
MVDIQHSFRRMRLTENYMQVLIFTWLLLSFSVGTAFCASSLANKSLISQTENRKLHRFPLLHSVSRDLPGFAPDFASFWDDHFLGRVLLTRMRSLILYRLFATSSSSAVAIGKDNWLFWLTEPVMANDPFTPEQLKIWAQLLQNRSDFLREHNIQFVFMPVPEKSTIYAEYLESRIHRREEASRLKQLIDYLQKHTTVTVVDLSKIFLSEKFSNQLYLRTDTHWTDYGALTAANQIFRVLQKSFPAISEIDPASMQPIEFTVSGDLAKMLGLYGTLTEKIFEFKEKSSNARTPDGKATVSQTSEPRSIVETKLNEKNLPRAFVIRDSFTLALQPFLSERFSNAKYYWSQAMPVQMLLESKPNVVIEEMAERHLYELGDSDGMAFGTWPYYPVRQNVHSLAGTEEGSKHYTALPLDPSMKATFANGLEIDGVSAVLTGDKLSCTLDWKALSDQIPNEVLTLHVLDGQNRTIAAANYPQNPSYLSFVRGDRWTDAISINCNGSKKPVRLGIAMYKTSDVFTRVQANNSDWQGFRALFPIKQ